MAVCFSKNVLASIAQVMTANIEVKANFAVEITGSSIRLKVPQPKPDNSSSSFLSPLLTLS